jgi:predicted amidohydrolase
MPDKKQSRIYRKTHLFYRERFIFDEGNSGFFVIDDQDRDIRIGTMICYDWRFPEASRTLGMLGADLVVCPSNLVTHIWPKVMPARAIENKVYLAVPNRFGSETANGESVSFNGMSGIWSYNGDLMAQADRVGESVITADIEPSKTRDKSFNEFNDIIKDRRPKYYKI